MSQAPPILDPRRLRGVLFVALLLGVIFAAMNFAILGIAGPAPGRAASRQIPMTWDVLEEAEERVAGLSHAYSAEGAKKNPFLVYVGLSSAWEGVDPAELAANDGWNAQVMPLCGKGGSGNAIEGMLDLTEPLSRRRLCPSLMVLCIHNMWLADRTDLATSHPPPSLNPLPPLLLGNWREALDRVAWWNWLGKNSVYTNRLAVAGLHRARVAMGLFPAMDPWSAPKRMGLPVHADVKFLQIQMSGIADAGVFDPSQYTKQGEQFVALNELITRFRSTGSPVLIVLMPERSAFRARVPAKAQQLLTDAVQPSQGAAGTPILDFKDAIDDAGFSDNLHLNEAGRTEFTRLLAHAIRDWRLGNNLTQGAGVKPN
jgi:hypothetical protein